MSMRAKAGGQTERTIAAGGGRLRQDARHTHPRNGDRQVGPLPIRQRRARCVDGGNLDKLGEYLGLRIVAGQAPSEERQVTYGKHRTRPRRAAADSVRRPGRQTQDDPAGQGDPADGRRDQDEGGGPGCGGYHGQPLGG